MVRPLLAALAAVLAQTSPAAAQPDWGRAGGDIFVATPSAAAVSSDAPKRSADPEPEGPVVIPAPDQPFGAAVERAAARHRLDPKLLHALVVVESRYRADAVSPVGAAGLTQLMPATARDLGVVDRFDHDANLAGGAEFLARQLVRFGDVRLALAAYNSGPDRVGRLGRVPRIPETQDYVRRVVDCYLALSAGRAVRTARDCQAAPS